MVEYVRSSPPAPAPTVEHGQHSDLGDEVGEEVGEDVIKGVGVLIITYSFLLYAQTKIAIADITLTHITTVSITSVINTLVVGLLSPPIV